MAYWIIIISMFFFMIVLQMRNGKIAFALNANKYILIVLAVCWMIAAFRNISVGADTAHYAKLYINICDSSWAEIFSSFKYQGQEIGWNILSKLVSLISNNYYLLQIITSAIFCFGFYPFIKKNSTNAVLAMSVFLGTELYLYSFNIARQMIAVMLVANAWDKLREEKAREFFFLVALACTFHVTSAIFLIVYLVYKLWPYKKTHKYLVMCVIFVGIFYQKILEFFTPILQDYYNYNNYLVNERLKQTAGLVVLFWIVIVFLSLYLIIKGKNDEDQASVSGLFAIFYVIMSLVGLKFNYMDRIGVYFLPFLIPMFDEIQYKIKNIYLAKTYMVSAIICFLIYFILSTQTAQYLYITFLNY